MTLLEADRYKRTLTERLACGHSEGRSIEGNVIRGTIPGRKNLPSARGAAAISRALPANEVLIVLGRCTVPVNDSRDNEHLVAIQTAYELVRVGRPSVDFRIGWIRPSAAAAV